MKLQDWLSQTTATLSQRGISTARLDALVLLEDRLKRSRAWVLAHPDYKLGKHDKNVLDKLVAQRAQHTPLAYIRGHAEFYGREFIVTADVLQPRSESEAMIEALKNIVHNWTDSSVVSPLKHGVSYIVHTKRIDNVLHPSRVMLGAEALKAVKKLRIADVGAGSGALGITAVLELPNTSVDLLEVSQAAIGIAERNVIKHTTGSNVVHSDLLAQSAQDYDILLCNLPYVPDAFVINEAATYEPAIALFGGQDGLDLYRRLFSQIKEIKKRPLYILTEALPLQHDALRCLAAEYGYSLGATDDFIQIFVTDKINDHNHSKLLT